jgi:two-component system response regulator YesN
MIVDVEMPGVNGIDAVKTLRGQGCGANVIFYTAHSQFEYAQNAIQARADSYILKPAKKERLIEVVNICIANIASDEKAAERTGKMQVMIDQISTVILSDFISFLTVGDDGANRMHLYAEALSIPDDAGLVMVMDIWENGTRLSQGELEEYISKKKWVAAYVSDNLRGLCGGVAGQNKDGLIICFVPVQEGASKPEIKLWSLKLADIIQNLVQSEFGLSMRVGIGGTYDSLVKMGISYREGASALYSHETNLSIRHFYDLYPEAEQGNPFTPYETKLLELVRQGEKEGCDRLVDEIFTLPYIKFPIDVLKDHAFETVVSVFQHMEELFAPQSKNHFAANELLFQKNVLENADDVKEWMKEKLDKITEYYTSHHLSPYSETIQSAIHYIEANLGEDISLDMVAQNIGVSPYYLSRKFKAEIGENFIHFINQLRIQKAKHLIIKYNYSIKEVSQKVGYQNHTYFCKVFKKITNMTPGEYKQSLAH